MERGAATNSSVVFGTPPEPLFNHTLCGVSQEMLADWIILLTSKNTEAVENAQPVQGASIIQDSVQFLFLTCDRLKMSSEVKYLSLELFDRQDIYFHHVKIDTEDLVIKLNLYQMKFHTVTVLPSFPEVLKSFSKCGIKLIRQTIKKFMIQHVQDLHEHVTNSSHIKTRGKDWEEIKKRVTNQVVLRVVSCIQIASKLTSHYRILSPNKAKRFLIDSGHRYNTESILQSELRILKTLNFCVSVPSPLVYLECLLEALGQAEPSTEVKVLHGVTLNLLDMVYLQYNEIYYKLHQVAAGGSPVTQKDRECFASVRADKMLLMATLITAAAYILDRDSHEKIMMSLGKITGIPTEDISDFASVILKTLLESSED